ncbi:acyltransferase domain-containing protein [Streptomyces sp. MUM 136J]|uniref:type I polyketide synthase n=1 Tax=Streptomyces sp. MUM 136J TaxID=2791992 RepID=UPI001F03DE66|nr:type I polyketide synthase [Streptomyces sp. MUM 136J]MCH0569853.1 acyltransferase domain-containing protein [Streptomyces sp. MUM 136J]
MPVESSPHGIHEIREFLLSRLVETLGITRDEVDRWAPLHRYGLDSVKATALVGSLEAFLGLPLPVTVIWDHPTLEGLCRALARGPHAPDGGGTRAERGHGLTRIPGPQEPIALVGVGCRLPGAPDPSSYWQLLVDGRDAVRTTPPLRAQWSGRDGDGLPRWGGYLDGIDLFDPLFFGISPREARAMDPQQRLVLELAWEALEDAGVPPGGLVGSDTGVFMGASWSDYAAMAHQTGTPDGIGPHTATGMHDSIIANRVSYVLGLQGPSMAVDTACSSSLVAVHLACQAIRSGESELALAGGVNVNFFADHFLAMNETGALSSDGRCKTFDSRADGTVRAEGAAVVVLAPLRVALERGLPVYCLLRGSAVNNDGLSNGLTAPNPLAQEALLHTAYRRAGIAPSLVDYVECHGTGTPLGDPIEAKALGTVLGADRGPDEALRIGSVKTNIGHLEPAAGIAGLVKVALALRNGVLPASLHYSSPNPRIPFAEGNLRVQERTTAWPRRSDARRAGVSAFGFGGTNCHVVAEELPYPEASLLLLAEDSPQALSDRVAVLLSELTDDTTTDLATISRQALRTRGDGPFRLAAAARSRSELREQLSAFTTGGSCPGLATGRGGSNRPKVAFLCSGTGSQWLGMGRQLLPAMPAFRASLLTVDDRLRALLGYSVVDQLLADEEHARLDDMEVVQPLLFAVQIALADAWRSLGVTPGLVLGQSVGEFAAAHIAGALDLDDATLLVAHHARLVQQLAVGRGDTMVVGADAGTVRSLLAAFDGGVTVSGCNSPLSTSVSGESATLRKLAERLAEQGVVCHPVRMGYAAHSPLVDPVLAPLRAALEGISPRAARIPLVSTVTGQLIDGEALGPDYWSDSVRCESRLMSAVQGLPEHDVDVVVELSPHPVLQKPVRESLAESPLHCLPSLQRGVDEAWSLLSSLGELHAAGHPVIDGSFVSGVHGRHLAPARRAAFTGTAGVSRREEQMQILPVSAHSADALLDTSRELSNHLERDPGIWTSDLAYTLATRRSPLPHRAALLVRDRQDVLDGLARVSAGEAHPDIARGTVAGGGDGGRIAFVFSGGGTHWAGMGLELLDRHTGFRERMEECDAAVRAVVGWSVFDALAVPAESSRLDETDIQQPVLFALQVALAGLWTDLGAEPAALIGHSIGEVAAACVGGALSLADGARVTAARSHLIQHRACEGAMISVEPPPEGIAARLAPYGDQVAVAAVNSPTSVTVSGRPEAIAALAADLRGAGIPTRSVRIDRPGHSALMNPLLPELRTALQGIVPLPFGRAFHSTALDGVVNPRVDADYWAHNLRNQVRFSPTVAALVEDGIDTFVEISPHGTLRGAIEETALAHGSRIHVVDSLNRGGSDTRSVLESVASLFARGVPLRLDTLYPENAQPVQTPLVRWQKQRHWLDTTGRARPAATPSAGAPGQQTADVAAPAPTAARQPRDVVLGEIADMLAVPSEKLGPEARLRDFGLDSMLAIRLSNRMQTLFGSRVSPVEFFDERTVRELLDRVLELVGQSPERAAQGGPAQSDPAPARAPGRALIADDLTEADAEELLGELVARRLVDPPEGGDTTGDEASAYTVLASSDRRRPFELAPASHGQAAIWFMQQLSPDGVAYNLMFGARAATSVDEGALERAVRAVVERHPALRTVFVEAGGRPYQLILDEPVYEFLSVDATGLDDDAVRGVLVAHGHRPLDLDRGPVLRLVLVSRDGEDDQVLLVIHHIAADATSVDLVVHDLQEFYGRALHGDLRPQEPVAPYTRFVEWERAWLDSAAAEAALSWWSEQLTAPPAHLDLPRAAEMGEPAASRPLAQRPPGISYEGEDLTFRWSREEARRLREFAVREGVSLSTLALAGFFATLNRVAGVEDSVLATAIAQRGEAGRESAVGYYLNTALVRARPSGHRSFHEVLHEVHAFSRGLLEHMDYPLDLLVAKLNPPRTEGRSPWFDFAVNWLSGDAFTYANTLFHGAGEPVVTDGALPLVPLPLERHIAKFDLEITMGDVSGEVVGQVQYKPNFLERQTVTTLLEHFRSVLFQAIEHPRRALERIRLDSRPEEAGL